jgi:type IV pilus assembly protein PilO
MAVPAFLAPIANAPRPQKIIFGVIGLVVIGAAAYFLLLSPLMVKVEQLTAQNQKLQTELLQARALATEVGRLKREIAQLEESLKGLVTRLPNERETPPLYRSVSDAAFQSGLAVSLFQPREAVIKDYYAEIPIVFTAEGSYHQFGTFFERMARLPRVVTVGDLKISGTALPRPAGGAAAPPPSSTGSTRGELVLSTYMYRPVGSPPPPKAPGAK